MCQSRFGYLGYGLNHHLYKPTSAVEMNATGAEIRLIYLLIFPYSSSMFFLSSVQLISFFHTT